MRALWRWLRGLSRSSKPPVVEQWSARAPLADRIVMAAMSEMDAVRVCSYTGVDGCRIVEGYSIDLARTGAGAVLDVLADALEGELCCGRDPEPQCLKCGQLLHEIDSMRTLADQVRDFSALEAT